MKTLQKFRSGEIMPYATQAQSLTLTSSEKFAIGKRLPAGQRSGDPSFDQYHDTYRSQGYRDQGRVAEYDARATQAHQYFARGGAALHANPVTDRSEESAQNQMYTQVLKN